MKHALNECPHRCGRPLRSNLHGSSVCVDGPYLLKRRAEAKERRPKGMVSFAEAARVRT